LSALKDKVRAQKAAAAQAEQLAVIQLQIENEERDRLAQEAETALANQQARETARAERRAIERKAGRLLTPSQNIKKKKDQAFVEFLQQQQRPVAETGGSDERCVPVMSSDARSRSSLEVEEIKDSSSSSVVCPSSTSPSTSAVTWTIREPICCILAHVDAGKTSLLDRIRNSRVQEREVGGITQQLGASHIPAATIQAFLHPHDACPLPGMHFVDTPGHGSFIGFRKRGSHVCDVALVLVNLMHGLEVTTHECIRMLREQRVPFMIVLNKVDKCYGWLSTKSNNNDRFEDILARQPDHTRHEFERRSHEIARALRQSHNLTAALPWHIGASPAATTSSSATLSSAASASAAAASAASTSPNDADDDDAILLDACIPMIPVSAKTGEGIGDLFRHLGHLVRTESLASKLKLDDDLPSSSCSSASCSSATNMDATVLEARLLPGFGPVVDVLLVRGQVRVGDTIVLAGWGGHAIEATVRTLLTAPSLADMRVTRADQFGPVCCTIVAPGLEEAVIGSRVLLLPPPLPLSRHMDDTTTTIATARMTVMQDVNNVLARVQRNQHGFTVHASTLGAIEALLDLLEQHNIPVMSIAVGPVHKLSIQRAATQTDEFASIIVFDTSVDKDAAGLAQEKNVQLFQGAVVYELCEQVVHHVKVAQQTRRVAMAHVATFPVILDILPQCIFNTKNPIVIGVRVREGVAKLGTQICCIPSMATSGSASSSASSSSASVCVAGPPVVLIVGRITRILKKNIEQQDAKVGEEVSIQLSADDGQAALTFGRHFDGSHTLLSRLTRESIDALKTHFKDDLNETDWRLVMRLKKLQGVL